MNIIQAIEDRRMLGSLFKRPETWANWRVFLKAVFALPMDAQELEAFRKYTGRERPPGSQVKEVFCVSGRRSGKSFVSALVASFLAAFGDWERYLGPGEEAYVLCIAADMKQAAVLLGYIKGIFELPAFRGLVSESLTWEVRLKNRVRVEVRSCSYRLLRGFSAAAVLADEACFWRSEGLNPAAEVLAACKPMLATMPGALLMVTSSPYSKSGPVWETYQAKFGKDDEEVLVWQSSSREMNETVPAEVVARALVDDPAVGSSEWLGLFRQDLETFLQTEKVEAVVYRGRYELPRLEGMRYFAGCDPSGGQNDAMTLGISHKDAEGKAVLDKLVTAHAPFAPLDCVRRFSEVLAEYGLREVVGDRYSGAWCSSAFLAHGVTFRPTEKSKSAIYDEFGVLVSQGQVELLDDSLLVRELRQLERRTRSGAIDSIDHPPGLHDDAANAAALACVLARGRGESVGRVYIKGERTSGPPVERVAGAPQRARVFFRQGPEKPDHGELIRQAIERWHRPPPDED